MLTKKNILNLCNREVISVWKKQPETFPEFLKIVADDTKLENELQLNALFDKLKELPGKPGLIKKLKKYDSATLAKDDEIINITNEVNRIVLEFINNEHIINAHKYLGSKLINSFSEQIKNFIRESRSFDNNLTAECIWQALRNYLIYAVIADLESRPQQFKTNIFSYSLLYPYTDNFLDNDTIRDDDKTHSLILILDMLAGKSVTPANNTEEKIKKLLDMLLNYYDGNDKTVIQTLLGLILDAQALSTDQQKRTLTVDELLSILSYKGGTSVLPDYYFSDNDFTLEKLSFYLRFGFFLQLADDIHDIKEDIVNDTSTLFTVVGSRSLKQKYTNKLIHYCNYIFDNYNPENNKTNEFIYNSCFLLVLFSAIYNDKYFHKDYIKKLEIHLPLSLDYIYSMKTKLKNKLAKTQPDNNLILKLLDIYCLVSQTSVN